MALNISMVCISQLAVPPVESAGNGMAQSNEALPLVYFCGITSVSVVNSPVSKSIANLI